MVTFSVNYTKLIDIKKSPGSDSEIFLSVDQLRTIKMRASTHCEKEYHKSALGFDKRECAINKHIEASSPGEEPLSLRQRTSIFQELRRQTLLKVRKEKGNGREFP